MERRSNQKAVIVREFGSQGERVSPCSFVFIAYSSVSKAESPRGMGPTFQLCNSAKIFDLWLSVEETIEFS